MRRTATLQRRSTFSYGQTTPLAPTITPFLERGRNVLKLQGFARPAKGLALSQFSGSKLFLFFCFSFERRPLTHTHTFLGRLFTYIFIFLTNFVSKSSFELALLQLYSDDGRRRSQTLVKYSTHTTLSYQCEEWRSILRCPVVRARWSVLKVVVV